MAELIDEGNRLLRKRKFVLALKKYDEGLSSAKIPHLEVIRGLNNKAQCLLILKKYKKSIEVCNSVIKIAKGKNEELKARLRKSKIYAMNKDVVLAVREIIKMDDSGLNIEVAKEKVLKERIRSTRKLVYRQMKPLDLDRVVFVLAASFDLMITTTSQLLDIEKSDNYDKWKLQDYFDQTQKDNPYTVCPKELFYVKKGITKEEKNLEVFYYHLFSQGILQNPGILNICFLKILFNLVKENKFLFFNEKQIINVGLVQSLFKGKDIIYSSAGVGNAGVARRAYKEHFFIQLTMEDESLQFIDFMGVLFNDFEFYKKTKYPVKVFDTVTRKDFKVEHVRHGGKLKEFVNKTFPRDFLKSLDKIKYFNYILVHLEDQLKKNGLLTFAVRGY